MRAETATAMTIDDEDVLRLGQPADHPDLPACNKSGGGGGGDDEEQEDSNQCAEQLWEGGGAKGGAGGPSGVGVGVSGVTRQYFIYIYIYIPYSRWGTTCCWT